MPCRREVATSILHIFKRQRARVGYSIPSEVVAALADRKGWSLDEMNEGILYGSAMGWFERRPMTFFRLTEVGVVEMEEAVSAI